MDETPVWFEMPGKSTLAECGEKEICVTSTGHEKEKLTVTLSAYADGTKLPPLVHLSGVRPPPKNEIPTGVVIYMCGAGKKSWANEESINFWLKRVWGMNSQRRRFLVWDAFRAHLTPSVKESVRMKYNSDLCVIPGGCTSKLQPADVSWNHLNVLFIKSFEWIRVIIILEQVIFTSIYSIGNATLFKRFSDDVWGDSVPCLFNPFEHNNF
jgi:hypothetical protein